MCTDCRSTSYKSQRSNLFFYEYALQCPTARHNLAYNLTIPSLINLSAQPPVVHLSSVQMNPFSACCIDHTNIGKYIVCSRRSCLRHTVQIATFSINNLRQYRICMVITPRRQLICNSRAVPKGLRNPTKRQVASWLLITLD